MGADGDGVAWLPGGAPLYVPDTLPGELVQPGVLTRRGEGFAATAAVLEPSPERACPPCPHFGTCGGCTLQHWQDAPYAAWKSAQVAEALRRAGVAEPPMRPLVRTPPAARRRMDLAIRRDGGTVRIGLHRRRSRDIFDMRACPILHPRLFAQVEALRPALAGLEALRREGSAVVNLLHAGPDLLLRTDGILTAADRVLFAALAEAEGWPRISWAQGSGPPEPACHLRPATIRFGAIDVVPPPGAFLQASEEGEAAITAAVLAGLPERLPAKARIVELFAGVGTLTHVLAGRARVQAFEGDGPALAALHRAGNPRVTAVARDLVRQPLTAAELKDAAAVVLDPPYAGAAPQMPALAASGVPAVVYVSCNPAALARDARVLVQAGYEAVDATPIDQFLWSAQVEAVVAFRRETKMRRTG